MGAKFVIATDGLPHVAGVSVLGELLNFFGYKIPLCAFPRPLSFPERFTGSQLLNLRCPIRVWVTFMGTSHLIEQIENKVHCFFRTNEASAAFEPRAI